MYLTLYNYLLLFIYNELSASCIQSKFFQLFNLPNCVNRMVGNPHSPSYR